MSSTGLNITFTWYWGCLTALHSTICSFNLCSVFKWYSFKLRDTILDSQIGRFPFPPKTLRDERILQEWLFSSFVTQIKISQGRATGHLAVNFYLQSVSPHERFIESSSIAGNRPIWLIGFHIFHRQAKCWGRLNRHVPRISRKSLAK